MLEKIKILLKLMKSEEYDALARVEYYLLPQDALACGSIEQIINSLDEIP